MKHQSSKLVVSTFNLHFANMCFTSTIGGDVILFVVTIVLKVSKGNLLLPEAFLSKKDVFTAAFLLGKFQSTSGTIYYYNSGTSPMSLGKVLEINIMLIKSSKLQSKEESLAGFLVNM